MRIRLIAILVLGLALGLLVSCAQGPAKAKVSQDQVQTCREVFQSLSLGTSKKKTLDSFKHGYTTRLSASTMDGVHVEECKAEAYHDDNWNKSRDQFIGFMYFANDKLVATSTSRIDYRQDPSIVKQWVGK